MEKAMTVQQIIALLQQMPPNADVEIEIIGDDGEGCYVATPQHVKLECDGTVTITQFLP
jgi:hypothetical protein